MNRLILLCWALLLSQSISAQSNIHNGELSYWKIWQIREGMFMKTKLLMHFDTQESLDLLVYVIPPGAQDSTVIGEKRESVINKEGKVVDKVSLASGPKEARAIDNEAMLFKSFRNKQMFSNQVFAEFNSPAKSYVLEDPIPDFGWRITEERKSIGIYECIKAVSQPFRGRVYEAWFAPAIPISNGPWKLGGLPGLILEAADQSGEVAFVFEKLVLNPEESYPVYNAFADSPKPHITWEQYVRMSQEKERKMEKFINSKGGRITSTQKSEIERTQ
jgi:GLPGLI family protein